MRPRAEARPSGPAVVPLLLLLLLGPLVPACTDPVPPAAGPVFDFEDQTLQGWTVEGDLPSQPVRSGRAKFRPHGQYFLGSAEQGKDYADALVGRLVSPAFAVPAPYALFRIGGGRDKKKLYLGLRRKRDNRLLRRSTGDGAEAMRTVVWDVADFVGQEVYFELVDRAPGPWGHLNVDFLRFVRD